MVWLGNSNLGLSFFQISGPLLPLPLSHHSMVRIGKGQAILGGWSGSADKSADFDPLLDDQANEVYHSKIYSLTCSNRNCIISLLDREMSVQKGYFVAIPIPDTISGCITKGKNDFQKPKKFYVSRYLFPLKYRLPVPKADWGWFLPWFQQQSPLFFWWGGLLWTLCQ